MNLYHTLLTPLHSLFSSVNSWRRDQFIISNFGKSFLLILGLSSSLLYPRISNAQSSTYPIKWATLVYTDTIVSGSEDTITNTRTNNCWCSGAISSTTLLEDSNGYINHVVNGLKTFTLGFYESEPVNVYSLSSIAYGFYAHSNGTLYAREGTSSTNIGTWASGDTLEINRSNDTIYYYQNGTQLRSKAATVTSDWLIGLIINTGLAQFENIRTNFNNEAIVADLDVTNVSYNTSTGGQIDLTPTKGATPYTYSWAPGSETTQDLSSQNVGTYTVTITDNNSSTKMAETGIGYLTDWEGLYRMDITNGELTNEYAANGWYANGAMSFNTLPASTDGWVEYEVQTNASGKYDSKVFGLKIDDHADITYYTDVDYYFWLSTTGEFRMRSKGVYSTVYGSYKPGDIMRVERVGTKIKYSKNGVPVDSTTVSSTEELRVQANIYSVNGKFENIRCSFGNKFDVAADAIEINYDGTGSGSIDITASGDHGPFTYQWSTSSTSEDLTNLERGDYHLTITNSDSINYTTTVGIGYPVRWDNFSFVTTVLVGDTLLYNHGSGGLNSFSTAANTLYQGNDGWVEYTINTLENKSFGFRDANITTLSSLADYDYAFNIGQLGYLQQTLSNTSTTIGYVNIGDVLRLEKQDTNLIFKKNGKILSTVAITDDKDLLIAAHIATGFGTLAGVRSSVNVPIDISLAQANATPTANASTSFTIEGGATPYTIQWDTNDPYISRVSYDSLTIELDTTNWDTTGSNLPYFDLAAMRYTDFVNSYSTLARTDLSPGDYTITVTDAQDNSQTFDVTLGAEISTGTLSGATFSNGTLTKTAADGWGNMLMLTENSIRENKDGWVDFTVSTTGLVGVVGFIDANASTKSYLTTNYGFYLDSDSIRIIESGSYVAEKQALNAGDAFRIQRTGNTIDYLVNGQILRTTTTTGDTPPLEGIGELYTGNATVDELNTYGPYWPSLNSIVTHPRCGFSSGSIVLDMQSSPAPPFTYAWSGGETTKDLFGLYPGTYTVTVTNSTNHTFVKTFELANQIRWAQLSNTTTLWPDDHSIEKNAGGTGWTNQAISENEYITQGVTTPSEWLEYTVQDENGSSAFQTFFGFKKSNSITMPYGFLVFTMNNGTNLAYVLDGLNQWQSIGGVINGDQLRLEYSTSNNTITYTVNGSSTQTYSSSVNDDLKAVGMMYFEGNEEKFALTSLQCEAIEQYSTLKKVPDGGYFKIVDGVVRVKYEEQYYSLTGNLDYNIYDNYHNDITNQVGFTNGSIVMGDNRLEFDVNQLAAGHYLLEVINEKNEKLYLRFKI